MAERLAPGHEADAEADRAELLRAVRHAIGDLLGSATQVFVLREEDRALAPVISAVIEQVPGAIRARRRALTERNVEALVDVYFGVDPLAAAMPDLERDNAEAQALFLRTWPVLTAEALARQAGHGSRNRSATASRWKAARRMFGVRAGGREVYPAFQFEDGRPKPVVGRILKALPARASAAGRRPSGSPGRTAGWLGSPRRRA